MPLSAHPEVKTLKDLQEDLDRVVGCYGPKGGFRAADRRVSGHPPTFSQWAMHYGLRVDSLGSTQKKAWEKTYKRALDAELSQVFGPSNRSLPEGTGAQAEGFLGYEVPLITSADARLTADNFRAKWNRRQNGHLVDRPTDLKGLVTLLRQVKTAGTAALTGWASHKTRSGHRTAGQAPSFVQWAAAAKVASQISRLHLNQKTAIKSFFARTIEARLIEMFWAPSGPVRTGQAPGRSHTLPNSIRHGSMTGVAGTGQGAYTNANRRRQVDEAENIFKWVRGRFVDFEDTAAREFLHMFPEVKAKDAMHIANSIWDSRDASGRRLTNFTKYLRRLAAYTVIKRIRPTIGSAQVHNMIFHDLNSLFTIVRAAVKAKTKSTIDPLEFVARLPSMPGILATDKAGMQTILQDIDHRFPEVMSKDAFLDELAVRIQLGGKRSQVEPLKDIVRRIEREEGAAEVERMHGARGNPDNRFALDRNRVPQPAVLAGMQNIRFALPSTNAMVRTQMRHGAEGFLPRGAGLVGEAPHGGTQSAGVHGDDVTQNLIRQVANELIAARSYNVPWNRRTGSGRLHDPTDRRLHAKTRDRRASIIHNRYQ